MKRVDTIARVRRAFYVQGWSVKKIVRELHVSRNTVRKILRTDETDFSYERERQPMPRIGPWQGQLEQFLSSNAGKPSRERLTLIRIFEELRGLGYEGGYDAVRRFAKGWSQNRGAMTAEAYVPLYYAPGEAYQFDWSHEVVVILGVTVTVKVAHVRLCHSRMMFARAYMRESQEMVFDAHDRAFAFFKGTCTRGIYDNMKTAVEAVFTGKERHYNRRFLQMCSHYLVQPVACTPASGWEKGQVENQVGNLRDQLFRPKPRVSSLAELNGWLEDQCIAYAKRTKHPEFKDRTIWEVFEEERPSLMERRAPFDGFVGRHQVDVGAFVGASPGGTLMATIQKLSRFVAKNRKHAVYDAHVVVIFDECHRSQFGDTHKKITQYFTNYQLFGFTGTPIFADNATSIKG